MPIGHDTTPQRDIQFYRNELDVLHKFAITLEPYTNNILQNLPPIYTT